MELRTGRIIKGAIVLDDDDDDLEEGAGSRPRRSAAS